MKPALEYHRRWWISKNMSDASMGSAYGYTTYSDDNTREATIKFCDETAVVNLDIRNPADLATIIAELQNLHAWLTTGAVNVRPRKKPSEG